MYDAGAGACFDVLSVNDYMLWSGPTDRRMRPLNINVSRPIYIRDIMVANGDADKPIWIGEMNANAVPNDPDIPDFGAYGQVTLEQQARYAPLAYQRIREEWPWVGVVSFWFFKRPDDREQNQAWYYFRMVEPDFTPLPVYGAMKAYAAGVSPTLYPGAHQEDDSAIIWEGDWETVEAADAALGRYASATTQGASVRFSFEGASLLLVPGPGQGEIEITVDGASPRRIPVDGQPARLVRAWRHRTREITLTAVGGEVTVDQFVVRGPWRPAPSLALGGAGAVLLAVWLSACSLRWR
jgi:hypothetical protein